MERIHVKVPGEQPQDREYMKQALALAEKGHGWVNPNPMVGAVLVKDGHIIGEGYHTRYGQLHAEREAFKNAAERGEETAGADLYVTLEPCCHTGKQPPCTEAVLASGVKRVIVGCTDPNPVVAGRGIRLLREKGLEVVAGVLRGECERRNEVFFHFMRTKLPFTVLKYAMTLDGKTATVSGKSQWITGEAARKRVHEDRGRYMAILTGVSTVQSAADLPDSGRKKSDPGDCRYEASDTAFIDRGTDRAGDTDLDCDGGIGCRKEESI